MYDDLRKKMLNCAYHPDQTAVAVCSVCGKAICEHDIVKREEKTYCMICASLPVQPILTPYPIYAQPGGYYPQPVQPLPYYKPAPPTNGLAIASMVTGILSVVFGGCYGSGVAFAIAALITGIIGRKQIKENAPMGGSGMAIAGIVTGAVGLLFGILWILLYIFAGTYLSSMISNSISQSGIIY
jgi:hypothetical protein